MRRLILLALTAIAMAAEAKAVPSEEAILENLVERGQAEIEGFVVSADVSRDEEAILLRDVEVTGPDGDGMLRADLVRSRRVSDLLAITDLLRPAPCTAWRARSVKDLQVEGLSLLADADSMPERQVVRERVDVVSLTGAFDQKPCAQTARFSFREVTVGGAGLEKLYINAIELASTRKGQDGRVIDFAVESQGLSLWVPAAEPGFHISRFAVLIAGDFTESGAIAQLSSLDVGGVLEIAAQEKLSLALEIGGLDVDVAAFLPPDIARNAGLEGVDEITGDLKIAVSFAEGAVGTIVEAEFARLFQAQLELVAEVGDRPALPGFILDALPVPEAVLGVSIARFKLAYEDFGLGEVLDAAGQPTPEALVLAIEERTLAGVADRLPGELRNVLRQATGSLARLFAQGGWVVMEPDYPVGLAGVVSAGLAGPEPLVAMLGFSSQIDGE